MINQLKNDRIAQIMLIGVILTAIFACVGVGVYGYIFLSVNVSPTVSPTISPLSTNIPLESILKIASSTGIANSSSFVIDGQIENISSDRTCFMVKVAVDYYDKNNAFITSDFKYITGIKPGELASFKMITLRQAYPLFETYNLKVSPGEGCIPVD